ncbi:histone-lysine N-methyltransferase SETD5 isoform X3 [Megalobrama amblycephala]|uniref:histone-lysine N-methyltransferase SETD5 isoform X3 n=1 Tax=Megalobrama amblycephala TaxID=75352 RepID=UPI0020148312|nr:histone-lysine N-methyltransferase SETD5 isoform X3 [Megalobrama amblycephala]
MSIVITLGVTTPETPYTDMAAGSDPESVEASPAVNEKNYSSRSCGNTQNHGYGGLPYADHNYGAPPPPTPPASPLSQTIFSHTERNGTLGRSRPCFPTNEPDNSADSESSSEEEEVVEGAVPPPWCQCCLMQDGFLIKCENCRGLEKKKGLDGQRRKAENVSVGESSATESGDEDMSASAVSYTATQHTPTSITLTVKRVKHNKVKKRKKSTEKTRTTPKAKKVKAYREGSRKSMRMKNSASEASVLDENTTEGWETRIRQWTDQYEEALANQYSADVQTLLEHYCANGNSSPNPSTVAMDTINRTELACNNTVLGSQMQLQLGRVTRVQKHRKILRAARNLDPETLIIEYRGKVMLRQQFEVNGHFFKKPYPFVLFYSKFNEVEMCVDARTFGNDARFIRRSCTPNAEVRHMIAEGMIHLCIYAVAQISKDSEVTIGFDYEFSCCNYKVDCACHKGNQDCPVQRHNLRPLQLPSPQSSHFALPGAETRRRRARRREMEGDRVVTGVSDESNHLLEDSNETQGVSDTEDALIDRVKLENGEELDENGALIPNRRSRDERKAEAIMHMFENLERRKKRGQVTAQATAEETKLEAGEAEVPSLMAGNCVPNTGAGGGVSTRRTSFATVDTTDIDSEKPPATPSPAPKAQPARSSKPRPKSRISRYRSSSAQRARRQRQALSQQAAEGVLVGGEEGSAGSALREQGQGEGAPNYGHLQDGELYGAASAAGMGNKTNVRYPKTKKYLVTEWLNDKVPERVEESVERPLRITTDPTVLATTLNMLPGLSHSPLICTTPKHYVRFGSPFNPERRRRPFMIDPAYGSCKKRWMKQALDESMLSGLLEDGTESNSSHKSNTSSTSSSLQFKPELTGPFKKRKLKCSSEIAAPPSELLLRPLSPITPPLPSELPMTPLHSLLNPCSLYLGGEVEKLNATMHSYSPLTSRPTSRCNTPLQFENISSPEASPVHRSESLTPEPCLRPDFTSRVTAFPDFSTSRGSPAPVSEDFSLAAPDSLSGSGGGTPRSSAVVSTLCDSSLVSHASEAQAREQAFRTEFNLIYTCSPLNANLPPGPVSDRHFPQSEGGFSTADSDFSTMSSQGLLMEAGSGSLSLYLDTQFGGGYSESSTSPHPSNPPQKKKRVMVSAGSQLAGLSGYQALAVRGQFKPGQNMVSLLEYRERKKGPRDPAPLVTNLSSISPRAESPGQPRAHFQPSVSPHNSFSPERQTFPQIEEVSPPAIRSGSHTQTTILGGPESNHWMVPTSVERLREGQGALERVLRGNLNIERALKRADAGMNDQISSRDKSSDALEMDRYDLQSSSLASPIKSPSVHPHQQMLPLQPESHQHSESPAYDQQSSSSPFCPSVSPSPPRCSSGGPSYYPSKLPTHSPLTQESPPSSTVSISSVDSSMCAPQPHSSSGGGMDTSGLKTKLLDSTLSAALSLPTRGLGNLKMDSTAVPHTQGAHGSRLAQSSRVHSQRIDRPSQANSRHLTASGAQHYPQRNLQGSGVWTQSGTF